MAFLDPFFHDVGMQLISPPQASNALLLNPPRVSGEAWNIPGAGQAIELARAWSRIVLREECQPPSEAIYIPFPREAGLCDAVRVSYQSEGMDLDVAQTFSMLSIAIKDFPARLAEPDATRAERAAAALLKTDAIAFQAVGTEGAFKYGKQRAPYDPFVCDWFELMRWWCEGSRVGFITIKATKEPVAEVLGPGKERNIRWFDCYAWSANSVDKS